MDTAELHRAGSWRFDQLGDLPDDGRRYELVEVVSPSSRKTDRFAKPGKYAEAGIPLYWRVETDPELPVPYRLTDGAYERVVLVGHVGEVPAPRGQAPVDLDAIRSAV